MMRMMRMMIRLVLPSILSMMVMLVLVVVIPVLINKMMLYILLCVNHKKIFFKIFWLNIYIKKLLSHFYKKRSMATSQKVLPGVYP
jgi:hypothetical protein